MTTTYRNPYPFMASLFTDGLDAIATALNPITDPTIDDLVTAVYDYMETIVSENENAPPERLLKAGIINCINAYINAQAGGYLQYDGAQMGYVYRLLEQPVTCSPDNVKQEILNIEDLLVQSGLTPQQQTPLFMTSEMGKAAFDYWVAKLESEGDWEPFMGSISGPRVNFPYWVAAAMEGSLAGFSLVKTYNHAGPLNEFAFLIGAGFGYLGPLAGALTVGAGKVVFKWEPREIASVSSACNCK